MTQNSPCATAPNPGGIDSPSSKELKTNQINQTSPLFFLPSLLSVRVRTNVYVFFQFGKKDNARGQPKKDNARGQPKKDSADAESHTASVESAVIDSKAERVIDTGNEKLKNRAVVEASNDFATRLMKEVFDSKSKSVCISPISISFVLAMSLAGAKNETEAELMKILGKGKHICKTKPKGVRSTNNHHCSSFLHCSQFVYALMCRRKNKDSSRGRPKKNFADETRAPSSANIKPPSDTESHADSVAEIDSGNEKLKNRAVVEARNDFKKKDNPRGRLNKESLDPGVTRGPSSTNLDPPSDAESHADSVESTVFDCTREREIDTGTEKLKNRAIVEASNDFATKLMKEVFNSNSESVCISPISISFVLAMSLAGAKNETKAELMKILGKGCSLKEIEAYFKDVKTVFQQLSELDILHNANRIYYDLSIKLFETYKEKVTGLYGIDSFDSLDFSDADGTAENINAFVEESTKGNLRNVITADQVSSSLMILLNALDFRGKWKSPFEETANVIHEFHLLNGDTKKTEMMTCGNIFYVTASDYFYYENDEMKRICLPYKNMEENGKYDYKKKSNHKTDVGEISMYIFLPRTRNGLPKLVEDLDGKKLLEWLRLKPFQNYRQKEPTVIDIKYKLYIKIPKFTSRTDLQLTDTLTKIGLTHYFSGNADFSGISDAPLQPGSVIHKTFIKTDEHGTEAYATTRQIMLRGLPEPPSIPIKVIEKEFYADRPFLYAIVSQKQHVLFIGTVMNVDEGSEEELKERKKQMFDAHLLKWKS